MCTPVSYFWNPSIGGHCLSRLGVWFANAALNIITDVVICLMPVPVLNRLSLPRKQKYALIAVFCLGLFVCLTSILRLKALYQISVSTDVTWDNTPAAYWSSLECNCSVVAACLPTLRKSISRFFPSFFSSPSKSDSNHRYIPSCRPQTKSRTNHDTSGFAKFAVTSHAAQADWQQTLMTQTGTARDISQKMEMETIKSKTRLSGESEQGLTMVDTELEDGRIRVMTTIVTRELTSKPSDMSLSMYQGSADSNPQERHLV
jgi:hypothetical protein